MPGSILSLSEVHKDLPIEAVARLVEWDGERAWQLEIRTIDGTILTQDSRPYRRVRSVLQQRNQLHWTSPESSGTHVQRVVVDEQ